MFGLSFISRAVGQARNCAGMHSDLPAASFRTWLFGSKDKTDKCGHKKEEKKDVPDKCGHKKEERKDVHDKCGHKKEEKKDVHDKCGHKKEEKKDVHDKCGHKKEEKRDVPDKCGHKKEEKKDVHDKCVEKKEEKKNCPMMDELSCKARDKNRERKAEPQPCPAPTTLGTSVPHPCTPTRKSHKKQHPEEDCLDEHTKHHCAHDESLEYKKRDPEHKAKHLKEIKDMDKAWQAARSKLSKVTLTDKISCKTEKPPLKPCADTSSTKSSKEDSDHGSKSDVHKKGEGDS